MYTVCFLKGLFLFVAQSCDQYCIQLLPYKGHTLTVCMIISMWTIVTTLVRSYNSLSLENKAHTYPQLFITNVIVSVVLLIHKNDVVIVMIHNLLTVYRPHTYMYSQQHNWSDGDSHSGQEKTSVGELESVRRVSCWRDLQQPFQ